MPATLEPVRPRQRAVPAVRRWTTIVLVQLGLLLVSAVGWETYRVLFGNNVHVVLPGRLYRGAQRSPQQLAELVRKHDIRTVLNLRGLCNPLPWYLDQLKVVQQLEISQEDVCLSAGRMPPAQELRRLLQVLDEAEKPIFLHCRRGSDRTGLACAVAMLLEADVTLEQARGHLHWRYGHVSLGRPAYLHRFFDLYEEWLAGRPHSPDLFRHWALAEYRGGWCRYEVEEFWRLAPPGPVPVEQPIGYHVKLRNTGAKTWNLTPHSRAGYHLMYRVRDAEGRPLFEGKGALQDLEVRADDSLTTTLVVPARLRPGRYRVSIDMIEEHQGWFFQMSGELMEEELEIRE
jgi:hypothetical protein